MDRTINNKMIILARESRGYTQSKLAELLKVTQGKISKVEQGLLGVSDKMINDLSNILKYPIEFFFESEQIYSSSTPFHRKRKSLSQKHRSLIEAKANIYRIHMLKFQNSVEIDENLIFLDLDDYGGSPENVAVALRHYWKIPKGPIDNITKVIEDAGIIIVHFDFHTNLLDGFTLVTPKTQPIIFINNNIPGDRLRFTLAHELGHIVMHQIPTLSMEDEANKFASEFLMPYEEIKHHLYSLSLPKLASLKPYWKVSMAALLTKAGQIGITTSNQQRYLWQQMAPYRKNEPVHLNIPIEKPLLMKELIDMHISYYGYSINELCNICNLFEDELFQYYSELQKSTRDKRKHLRIVKM